MLTLPFDFYSSITNDFTLQLNAQSINYDRVRNLTKYYQLDQTIFTTFKEIVLTVPYHANYQILVKIKNFPVKQIYLYDHFQSNHEQRAQIFKFIKGYIFFEKLDKSNCSSNEAMSFAEEYVEFTKIIEPFVYPNIRIQYIHQIKQLSDGYPMDPIEPLQND